MADVKATEQAKRLVEEFVKNNPWHPAAQQFLKAMANAGPLGSTRARQLSEGAMARQLNQGKPTLQVNPITKARRKK